MRLASEQGRVEEHGWRTRRVGSRYWAHDVLGLYITRPIVEQHRGHIQAEVPRDGATRLVVVLPVG